MLLAYSFLLLEHLQFNFQQMLSELDDWTWLANDYFVDKQTANKCIGT